MCVKSARHFFLFCCNMPLQVLVVACCKKYEEHLSSNPPFAWLNWKSRWAYSTGSHFKSSCTLYGLTYKPQIFFGINYGRIWIDAFFKPNHLKFKFV